jgi:hypothetical protein
VMCNIPLALRLGRVCFSFAANTAKCITVGTRLHERVKDFLHVVVLLEFVDERQYFGGLRFR